MYKTTFPKPNKYLVNFSMLTFEDQCFHRSWECAGPYETWKKVMAPSYSKKSMQNLHIISRASEAL